MTATSKRGRRPDPAKDAAILDAASALFLDRGYSVSIDDIAAAAGVSKQTVYARFASKEELFEAVVRSGADQLVGALFDAQRGLSLDAALTELGAGELTEIGKGPISYRQVGEINARARKLIKATRIDLATISTRCGFGSYSHFLRRYRETFGSTPSHDRITADIKGLNSTFSPLQDLHPNQQQMDPIRLI